MAINGFTHEDGKMVQPRLQFKGKISTGFAPGEGANNTKYPQACGYFRILKTATIRKTVPGSGDIRDFTKWVLNEPVQAELEKITKSNKPTMLPCISMVYEPKQMWDSYLAWYNGNNDLVCKGYGKDTVASFLTEKDGKRVRVDRQCKYKQCPDYIEGKCAERGDMVVWPKVDFNPLQPYKLTTGSLGTISFIESMLNKIYAQLRVVHAVKCGGMKNPPPFKGLFGMKFILKHEKTKSGGRDVYITKVVLPESVEKLMGAPMLTLVESENPAALLNKAYDEAKAITYQESDGAVSISIGEIEDPDHSDAPHDSGDADSFDADTVQVAEEEPSGRSSLTDKASAIIDE